MPKHKDKKRKIDALGDYTETPLSQLLATKYNNSVVKIFVTSFEPDYYSPWRGIKAKEWYGTGSVINAEQGLILTCAHVCRPNGEFMVRLANGTEKFPAKILISEADCDLALIQVDSPDFLENISAVQFGYFQPTGSEILVVGFPFTGNELTEAEGTVSGNEIWPYVAGEAYNLCCKVDAAINGGNSGGPVFDKDGNQVGVAFQAYDPDIAEHAGSMIPMPVIKQFLKAAIPALARGTPCPGVPDLPIDTQQMDNPAIRAFYGMNARLHTGVRVTQIDTLANVGGLKVDDIILSIDGHAIHNDGCITSFPDICDRLNFMHLIYQKQISESIRMKILRQGQEKTLTIPLLYRTRELKLGGRLEFIQHPRFYIKNGLCFQPYTTALTFEEVGVFAEPNFDIVHGPLPNIPKAFPDQELVFISHSFKSEITEGYEGDLSYGSFVHSVNGQIIKNFDELVRVMETNTSKEVSLALKDKDEIILRKANPEDELEIALKNDIRSLYSDDLSELIESLAQPKTKSHSRKVNP